MLQWEGREVYTTERSWWHHVQKPGGMKVGPRRRCLLTGPVILTDPDRYIKATSHLSSPSQLPRSKGPYAGQSGETTSTLGQERREVVCFW